MQINLTDAELRVIHFCLLTSDLEVEEYFNDTEPYHALCRKVSILRSQSRQSIISNNATPVKKFEGIQLELDLENTLN